MARERFDGIQVLRGFAALAVVGFHLYAAAISEGGTPGPFVLFALADVGVDLFFVISGFIIVYVAGDRPDLTARAFLAARFWRVVPPYWLTLVLTVAAAAALVLLTGDDSKLPSMQALAISVLLVPFPDHVMPIAWTLTLEAMFYVVFAATWFRGPRTFFAAMGCWIGFSQLGVTGTMWELILHPLIIEFLFGALIAVLLFRGPLPGVGLAMLAGSVGLAAYLSGETTWIAREWSAGLPAAALVYGVAAARATAHRCLVLLGEASYTLYLSHLLVFSIAGRGTEILTGVNLYQSWVGLLILLGLAVSVAVAATLWLERPYRAWVRRRPLTPGPKHLRSAQQSLNS